MAVFTLSFKCRIESDSIKLVSGEQPKEGVELRVRRISRLVPGPPSGASVQKILKETTFAADQPIQVATVDVLPLSLHEFKADPAKYENHLEQFLSRHCIFDVASETIVEEILQYVSEPERERRLHAVVEVDRIELNWTTIETKEEEEDQDPKSEIGNL